MVFFRTVFATRERIHRIFDMIEFSENSCIEVSIRKFRQYDCLVNVDNG